jgi:hypothetical protein
MPNQPLDYPALQALLVAAILAIGGVASKLLSDYFRLKNENKQEVVSYTTKNLEAINAEFNTVSQLLAECLRGRDDQVLAALVRIEYKLEKLEEDLDQVKSINTYNARKRKKALTQQ